MSLDLGESLVMYDPAAKMLRAEGCYDSYQTKSNRPMDYLVKVLQNEPPVMSFQSSGMSSRAVVTALPKKKSIWCGVKDVNAYLITVMDVYLWAVRDLEHFWVHEKALSVILPGVAPEPVDSQRLEGARLSFVLSSARHLRHSSWYYWGDMYLLRPFLQLLPLNGAAYRVRKRGGAKVKIKISWW